jgi:hypothetical protein
MLPDTLAPAPEILPSATVKVELAVGSQLPLFVTIVTFQSPSYGVCARAGAVAEAVAMKAKNTVAMRLRRMNQILDLWGCTAYLGTMWPKFDASQKHKFIPVDSST